MNGSLALLEREGKDTMFSQQFIIVGLQPEVSMGNSFQSLLLPVCRVAE